MFNKKKLMDLECRIQQLEMDIKCIREHLTIQDGPSMGPSTFWAQEMLDDIRKFYMYVQALCSYLNVEIKKVDATPKRYIIKKCPSSKS